MSNDFRHVSALELALLEREAPELGTIRFLVAFGDGGKGQLFVRNGVLVTTGSPDPEWAASYTGLPADYLERYNNITVVSESNPGDSVSIGKCPAGALCSYRVSGFDRGEKLDPATVNRDRSQIGELLDFAANHTKISGPLAGEPRPRVCLGAFARGWRCNFRAPGLGLGESPCRGAGERFDAGRCESAGQRQSAGSGGATDCCARLGLLQGHGRASSRQSVL
jgi:hypothetical protein